MHFNDRTNVSAAATTLLIGATIVAFLFHPKPLVLAIIGATMILAGLAGAVWIALRNRSNGLQTMDGMTIPAILVFAGCAATIICDLDAAVSALR